MKKWTGADMRCTKCGKYLPDRCTCNGPSIEAQQQDCLASPVQGAASASGEAKGAAIKTCSDGLDEERYCLGCDKAGHRTDECWSTRGLNTPQARELHRLCCAVLAERAQAQPSGVVACRQCGANRALSAGLCDVCWWKPKQECHMVPLSQDGEYVFIEGAGAVRLDYGIIAATPAPKQAQPSGAVEELTLQQVVDAIRGRGIMSPTGFRRFLNGDSAEMAQHQIVALCNLFATPAPKQEAAQIGVGPIYQVWNRGNGGWNNTTKADYDAAPEGDRQIIYRAPVAQEASQDSAQVPNFGAANTDKGGEA